MTTGCFETCVVWKYSTFQRPTGDDVAAKQPAYLRLSLDNDGDDVRDESIYFIPANNARQGSISRRRGSVERVAGRWSIL
ncbi:MAG: hypothetical protein WKF82_11030 [Nocardioidaceae bacterium]